MADTPAPPTTPTRTITLVRPADGRGVGVFCISDGKKYQFYTFREIPCEIGGRGFAVHRLGQGMLYHVRVGQPDDRSCECMGFLRWDHCKHISGLTALIKQGKLPPAANPRRVTTPLPTLPTPPRTDSGA